MSLALADFLATLWSHLTSFWPLIYRNPAQGFYFKYQKASDIAITKEGRADGGLDLEVKDSTHDMTRRLEITALDGAGRVRYRTGRRAITSTAEESNPRFRSGNHLDSSAAGNIPESTSPNSRRVLSPWNRSSLPPHSSLSPSPPGNLLAASLDGDDDIERGLNDDLDSFARFLTSCANWPYPADHVFLPPSATRVIPPLRNT
ncbi:hypothetical protein BKA70DRAFT_1527146 [Coprinopsis sp. MPI-PUGE-AT-0042]|nr:hypothetical protein BKA70DRAFT_1527146 [Coprinopsis sp. MPI-PUGE-AT-0042]